MKEARYVSVALLGIFVVATAAKADPSDSSSGNNPYLQTDADGVPLSMTPQQSERLSPEDVNALRKEKERSARDKDWLLRAYEQQLQNHAGTTSQDQSANLYFQLSSNKDLAKLAGLPLLDSDTEDGALHQTGGVHPNQGSAPSRSDASSAGPLSRGNLFKPLITPLGAPAASGLHNFYSFLPAVLPPNGSLPKKSAVPAKILSDDSSDIQTPGMIADKNNPLTPPDASDLTLELLPGESIEQARAHQDENNNLQLPLPMDANQLHKAETDALSVPGQTNAAQKPTAVSTPVKTVPTEDPEAPIPVNQLPQINPVRAPIANPFDILNR